MLSRDYILRIIQTFFEVLEKLFDGKRDKSEEAFQQELDQFYMTYFERSRLSFVSVLPEVIIDNLKKDPYFLEKSGMLAELFYREYLWAAEDEQKLDWGRKAAYLYDYILHHSSDYSLVYADRLAELKTGLSV